MKTYNIKQEKRTGFTLAEVLITLGIIGVVAAMTIPTLIANTTGAKYRTKFKKAVSTLSQVALMNKANYGWDYAGVNIHCGSNSSLAANENSEERMSVCALLNTNLSSHSFFWNSSDYRDEHNYYFKNNYIIGNGPGTYYLYLLSDGTIFGVKGAVFNNCTIPVGTSNKKIIKHNLLSHCEGFIDVNGLSLPNEEIDCSTGTRSRDLDEPCVVKDKDIKDVYPVLFHDSTVEAVTNAANYVLKTAK